jgi:hypothetical protein
MNRWLLVLMVGAASLQVGCASPRQPGEVWKALAPWERASCVGNGGRLVRLGVFSKSLGCAKVYTDGGKPCTGRAQCQGGCIPAYPDATAPGEPRGVCEQFDEPMASCDFLENNKRVEGQLCE